MKLSLKPHHLKRYKDIAMLFWKYGASDLAKEFETEDLKGGDQSQPGSAGQSKPEELADDLEKMGPTFIKFGQLLSSRPDLLPEPYLKALARLQDKVKPFPYSEVEQIVASELGVRISKAFSFFDQKHLAAASLGQVHLAALRDGRAVVVKVQRPDIRRQIMEDFEVLEEIAGFFDEHTEIGRRYRFGKLLAEFKSTLLSELDYQREASNLTTLARNLQQFPHIFVPLPVVDFSSRHVLTMDYVEGAKITALSPLVRMELNGNALAEEFFQAYLKQVLVDGFFHADPHPGNIFLTQDGRLALLDLGMTGRLTVGMQENLLRLLLAVSEGNGDEAVKIIMRVSEVGNDFKEAEFRKQANDFVSEQLDHTLDQQNLGKALLQMSRAAAETGLYVPTELTILGKTLLQLEEVGKTLSPEFNPNESVRRNVAEILRRRVLKAGTPGNLFGSILEMKDFVGGLPERVNKILDAAGNAEFEVKVRTPDAKHLLNGFEKIANRVTTGIVLAALIVGAALMMRINSSFQILGYPGIAMICFLIAIGGSGWLIIGILWKDWKDKRKQRDD
ncbi:MAG: AarF/UbiB family protein [Verrucomicrobiota bacterium]|jgi:predicted unusual protein kinase regulating ubiquinone biosynthesis (AarF/ABC1/UbiB family)